MRPSWPRVRAALIAVALALGLVDGLPIPTPENAARFPRWAQAALDALRLEQARILAPFLPIRDELVLLERWSLFSGAKAERFRLEIAGRRDGHDDFELLYRADDQKHRMLADVLEYRRVRGAFNPRTREPPDGYASFVSFVAARLFESSPKLVEVRVRLEEIHLRDRGRGYASTGRYLHEQVRSRRTERR